MESPAMSSLFQINHGCWGRSRINIPHSKPRDFFLISKEKRITKIFFLN